ncbi:FUN14 domain-containing protein 2 [Sparganum proliferum]
MIGGRTDSLLPTADPRMTSASDRTDDVLTTPSHVVRIKDLSGSTGEVASSPNGALSQIERRSNTPQIVLGSASGIATGYICAMIGKSIIFLIGIVMIALQFFEVPQRLLVDGRQMMNGAWSFLKQTAKFDEPTSQRIYEKAVSLFRENQIFFRSFFGGFLIGLSFF